MDNIENNELDDYCFEALVKANFGISIESLESAQKGELIKQAYWLELFRIKNQQTMLQQLLGIT